MFKSLDAQVYLVLKCGFHFIYYAKFMTSVEFCLETVPYILQMMKKTVNNSFDCYCPEFETKGLSLVSRKLCESRHSKPK